jgi:N-acyl homoserine lactone hydrolase
MNLTEEDMRLMKLLYPVLLLVLLLLQACSLTSHPVKKSMLGQVSSTAEMERLLEKPGPVQLDTINSADWSIPLSGLLNLHRAAAIQAGLKDRDEPIHIFAHILQHPEYGTFLVDTGMSRKLLDDPGKFGWNWFLLKVIPMKSIRIQNSTAQILDGIHNKLSGVFFTHLHSDHISGLPDIGNDIPLYIGKGESSTRLFINMFTYGASNKMLEGKPALQEWNFVAEPGEAFSGVVDIFGDGSVFAIGVPGHTPGSTAYLVRTPKGPVLLTGDTSHTRWGWEHGVEPGDYTRDNGRNLQSLLALKALVSRHPAIEVRLGHQY